jgi:hypothetical protein
MLEQIQTPLGTVLTDSPQLQECKRVGSSYAKFSTEMTDPLLCFDGSTWLPVQSKFLAATGFLQPGIGIVLNDDSGHLRATARPVDARSPHPRAYAAVAVQQDIQSLSLDAPTKDQGARTCFGHLFGGSIMVESPNMIEIPDGDSAGSTLVERMLGDLWQFECFRSETGRTSVGWQLRTAPSPKCTNVSCQALAQILAQLQLSK